jgi:hypothetical protein
MWGGWPSAAGQDREGAEGAEGAEEAEAGITCQ